MGNHWNGSAEREKLSSQRKAWKMCSATIRNDQLTNYETLKAEWDSGVAENKASLARQKELELQIKVLQAEIALDKHRTDLPAQVLSLRRDITKEKALHSEWGLRQTVIDAELLALKQGPLAGIRINSRRPGAANSPRDQVQTLLLCLEINLFLKVRQLSSSQLIQLYELQEASPTLACTIHHGSNS
jgi:hypothetical protein